MSEINISAFRHVLRHAGWRYLGYGVEARANEAWQKNNGPIKIISNLMTYDFISQIKIEDWEIYSAHLEDALLADGRLIDRVSPFHNAPLWARVKALALSMGWEEKS